nr:MAG: nonstructural protein [Picornaviridae sp.]
MAYYDKTSMIDDDSDDDDLSDLSYPTPILRPNIAPVPDCRMLHLDKSQWWKDNEVMVAQAGPEASNPPDIKPGQWYCTACASLHDTKELFMEHLDSEAHKRKLNIIPPDDVPLSDEVKDPFSVPDPSQKAEEKEVPDSQPSTSHPENPESVDQAPSDEAEVVYWSRDYITTKLSELLHAIGDVSEALPQWIKTHTRFIVNLVCSCVNIVFSTSWMAVVSSLVSIVNEICNEFPDLIRTRVNAMVDCLKQVIRRYFPHAEAAPSVLQDERAANESFITSLFGILGSLVPGVRVEAGLLKARVERIKNLSVVLTSTRTIGQWFCTLFDKLWTWVQIYFYGATSDQLARQKAFLNSPELQLWINDISAFELGKKKEDGTFETPGVSRLLIDPAAQEEVISLKKRGEEFLETTALGDNLRGTKVMQLIQHNLRKVHGWFKIFEDSRGVAEDKHEPFIIYLYGDPGIGKTYCTNYLCQALASVYGIRDFSRSKDVFSKARGSDYFDGYNNQFCYLMDDFLQVNDDEANKVELGFLIDSGSRARQHLNMATIERKASSYFTSPLILITSNSELDPRHLETLVQSYGALARRIDMMVEVRRKEGWSPDPALAFDHSGLFFSASQWKIKKNMPNGLDGEWHALSGPMDWKTFVCSAMTLFARKLQKQKALDTLLPLPDDIAFVSDDLIARFATSNVPDDQLMRAVHEQIATPDPQSIWKRFSKNPFTNQSQYHNVQITMFKQPESSLAQHRSASVSSVASRKYENEHPDEQLPVVSPQDIEIGQEVIPDEIPRAQAGPPAPQEIPCPATGCSFYFTTNQMQHVVFEHILYEARPLTVGGDAHVALKKAQIEQLLNRFPTSPGRVLALTQREHEWYAKMQELTLDYQPRGAPWTLSELLGVRRHDLIRVYIDYFRAYDHVSLLTKIAMYPYHFTLRSAARVRQGVANAMQSFWSPVAPVLEAAKAAQKVLDTVASSLKKMAVLGIVFASVSSVFAVCYLKWYATKSVTQHAEKHISGDQTTAAKKKRRMHVEEAAEKLISGDERTAARKKKKIRAECKYAAPFNILAYSTDVTLKRTTTKPDMTVTIDAKDVVALWTDGDSFRLDRDAPDRDLQLNKFIERKLFGDPEDEEEEEAESKISSPMTAQADLMNVESQTSRLQLVEKLIGEIPLAEGARDKATMKLAELLSQQVFRVTNLTRPSTLNGFILCNKIAVIPRHILGHTKAEGTHLHFVFAEGTFQCVLGPDYPYYEDLEKDTLFIDLHKTRLKEKRTLVKHFIDEEDEIKRTDGYLCTLYDAAPGQPPLYVLLGVSKLRPVEAQEYLDDEPEDQKMITIVRGVSYEGDSQPGDCGALILRVDPHEHQKILGFHVCGGSGTGTATLWTQTRLNQVLTHFQRAQGALEFKFAPADVEEFFDCYEYLDDDHVVFADTHCDIYGNIDPAVRPGVPLTTKLQPSPLFNKVMETISGPSTIRPFIDDEGNKIEPLKLALAKLESPTIHFDQTLVDRCAKRMIVDYASRGLLKPYTDAKAGKLTLEENIGGVKDDKWIKPVNMKTSPGYPYVLAGGKHLYMNLEERTITPLLKRAMDERESAAREGREVPALMMDILKDERLPNEKRKKGKVRIFNVCPLDFNLLVRKYFTRFLAQMMEHHIDGEVAVGINAHGEEWETFYRIMNAAGSHWVAGDYSAWDKRAPLQIAMAGLGLVEEFYQKFSDYEPQDAVVRRTLLLQAFQSIRLSQTRQSGLIYKVHQSMPSGIAITAVYNSIINSLLFRVIFAELAMKKGWRIGAAVNTYSQHVRFSAYGDDHIARVSKIAFPWFNMLSISKQMAEHGITYTATTKGEVTESEVQLADLTYLKRHFVKRGARMDAPMELPLVLDILNWVSARDEGEIPEACACAIKSVIIELSHFSREEFLEWYPKIVKEAIKADIEVPIVEYDDVVQKRRLEPFDYYDDFY